jgi:hypothetical protein
MQKKKEELLPPITTQASKNHILLSLDYCIQIEKKKTPHFKWERIYPRDFYSSIFVDNQNAITTLTFALSTKIGYQSIQFNFFFLPLKIVCHNL